MFALFAAAGFLGTTRTLPAGPGPLDNPLKGFAAYSEPGSTHSCPVSMTFQEIPWKVVEPAEGQYAFDAWEKKTWDVPPAKGKPVVMRIFLDYPHQPVATPQWLIDKGVKMTRYEDFGGGYSPDYENPTLRAALKRLIAEMGKRYDRDPRVAFVQMGFLGHWGEWHTYPTTKLFASPEVQSEVVEAMRRAFPHKKVMARNASYPSCQKTWMGFFDDMLPQDTMGTEDWQFLPPIEKAGLQNNWKTAPTGGEMVPGATKQYLGKDWPLMLQAVAKAHFTWVGPYCPALEKNGSAEFKERANELIRKLGYEFRLTNLTCPNQVEAGKRLGFEVQGVNQGVAPFYYPWKVQVALLDEHGVAQKWDLSDDIREWLPGEFEVKGSKGVSAEVGHYKVGFGIVDPATNQPAIHFANTLEVVDGYTILGDVEVVKPLTK